MMTMFRGLDEAARDMPGLVPFLARPELRVRRPTRRHGTGETAVQLPASSAAPSQQHSAAGSEAARRQCQHGGVSPHTAWHRVDCDFIQLSDALWFQAVLLRTEL